MNATGTIVKAHGKCVVWGAGGHAKVVAEILRLSGYEVVGFIDEISPARKGERFYGSVVLGGAEALDDLRQSEVHQAIVGIGDNVRRVSTGNILISQGFNLVKAVHPNVACASDVALGAGTVLASGAIIGPSTSIGAHVIVNTKASIDHDCSVADGAHVGPGAIVTGCDSIGECAWIGAGGIISDHRTIGAYSIVGAGAVVLKDVQPKTVVAGVPAVVIRLL